MHPTPSAPLPPHPEKRTSERPRGSAADRRHAGGRRPPRSRSLSFSCLGGIQGTLSTCTPPHNLHCLPRSNPPDSNLSPPKEGSHFEHSYAPYRTPSLKSASEPPDCSRKGLGSWRPHPPSSLSGTITPELRIDSGPQLLDP